MTEFPLLSISECTFLLRSKFCFGSLLPLPLRSAVGGKPSFHSIPTHITTKIDLAAQRCSQKLKLSYASFPYYNSQYPYRYEVTVLFLLVPSQFLLCLFLTRWSGKTATVFEWKVCCTLSSVCHEIFFCRQFPMLNGPQIFHMYGDRKKSNLN